VYYCPVWDASHVWWAVCPDSSGLAGCGKAEIWCQSWPPCCYKGIAVLVINTEMLHARLTACGSKLSTVDVQWNFISSFQTISFTFRNISYFRCKVFLSS
jgi:hypothetical protein